MIRKLSIVLILFFVSFGPVFSDTDGVWHEAEDVRVGTFGSDEGDTSTPFKFENPVEVNNTLKVSGNEGMFDLIGINHTYMQFFPKGLSSLRGGWFGFGSPTVNNLYVTNGMPNGNLVLRTNGAVVVEKNLTVAGGKIIIGDDGEIRDVGFNYLFTNDLFDSSSGFKAPIFYDRVNTGYFMNLSGISKVGRIVSTLSTNPLTNDELVTKGYVDLNDDVNDLDSVVGNEYPLPGSGISITSDRTVSVDTSTVATKAYVESRISTLSGVGGGSSIGYGDTPLGAVMAFNLETCPEGWTLADGSGSTPDLRGTFIRGTLGNLNGRDVARIVGDYQVDDFDSHRHGLRVSNDASGAIEDGHTGSALVYGPYSVTSGSTIVAGSRGSDNYNTESFVDGGSETRPKNVALTYCMKTDGNSDEIATKDYVASVNLDNVIGNEYPLAGTGIVISSNRTVNVDTSTIATKSYADSAGNNVKGWVCEQLGLELRVDGNCGPKTVHLVESDLSSISCTGTSTCTTPTFNICNALVGIKSGDKFSVTTDSVGSCWNSGVGVVSYEFTYGTPFSHLVQSTGTKRNYNSRIYDGNCLIHGVSTYGGASTNCRSVAIKYTNVDYEP